MSTQTLDRRTHDQILHEWLAVLDSLVCEASSWVADQPGWSAQVSAKEISEEVLGTYTAPVLTVTTDSGRLVLDPIARIVLGGTGTVELYAWPTLYRVRLLHNDGDGGWRILTDSGISLKQPWNRSTFIELANDLIHAS